MRRRLTREPSSPSVLEELDEQFVGDVAGAVEGVAVQFRFFVVGAEEVVELLSDDRRSVFAGEFLTRGLEKEENVVIGL